MLSKKVLSLVVVFVCLCVVMSTAARAVGDPWISDGLEWQDPAQFGGTQPTSSDEVYLGWTRTSWVASSGNVANNLKIGAANQGGNQFTLQSGDLTLSGLLDFGGSSPSDLFVLQSGSLSVGSYVNLWSTTSTFQVVGGNGVMTGGAYVNAGGIIEFVVDGTGISTIPWNVGSLGTATISLVSDGAAPGVYDLFDGSVGGSFVLTYDNPANWDTSNLMVDGTVTYIPEPATLALMGFGLCGVIRRRFRK